jgi:hypothetical protein
MKKNIKNKNNKIYIFFNKINNNLSTQIAKSKYKKVKYFLNRIKRMIFT